MICGAIAVVLCACYTPLNNSGVATTKAWLEVPAKRVDFDGKQYDSCVQFNLRFWPQEAVERLDLQAACITACCWRSEQSEITLDFNKGFEEELLRYGVARKYTPEKITLKVTHSNLVNVTKVTVSPRGAISSNGLAKLSYTTVRDETRLAQIEEDLALAQENAQWPLPVKSAAATQSVRSSQASKQTVQDAGEQQAKECVQRKVGAQIDDYFYQMNKIYRKQDAIFILSARILVARPNADGTYQVTCHAKARTGTDEKHLNSSDFPCGVWLTDINAQMVLPDDKKARQILQ